MWEAVDKMTDDNYDAPKSILFCIYTTKLVQLLAAVFLNSKIKIAKYIGALSLTSYNLTT